MTQHGKQASRMPRATISLRNIDIDFPPGIAGDICKDIESNEYRALPALRPSAALYILSAIAGSAGHGLYVINTALTSSGKEAHQKYIKEIFVHLGIESKLRSQPRSDRSIIEDLLECEGQMHYLMDEGHSFFRAALGLTSSNFEKNMLDLMLSLKTTSHFTFPGNIAREHTEKLQSEMEKLRRKRGASEKRDSRLRVIENRLKMVEAGIKNPHVSFLTYSVPDNCSFMLTRSAIKSGLLGRILLIQGPNVRAALCEEDNKQLVVSKILMRRLISIFNGQGEVEFGAEAALMLKKIKIHLDAEHRRNHPDLGGIYARGYEQIKVIATILGSEERYVDVEMVNYAYMFFRRSINLYKTKFNSEQRTTPIEIVQNKLVQYIEKKGVVTKGVLKNYTINCSKHIQELIQRDTGVFDRCLDELEKARVIEITNNGITLM